MQRKWFMAGRAVAVVALVVANTAISPVAGGGAVYGQTGNGGVARHGSLVHCADDGLMRWGAATWSGATHNLWCLPAAGLAAEARQELLARLRDRNGGRVYVEVMGPAPAEVIIERKPRRDVYLGITDTPDNGQSRGDVRVRSPGSDDVPVIFVTNNRQERLVLEAPDWLHWVTVVVNGVVQHDAAWLGR